MALDIEANTLKELATAHPVGFYADEDFRRSATLETQHQGEKAASRFAELRAEHHEEAQLLGVVQNRDPVNDDAKLLHREEARYFKDQMKAETLGLHYELKGDTKAANDLYDMAARFQHSRAELRNVFMSEGETFGADVAWQIRGEPHSRPMRDNELIHLHDACREERAARGFPPVAEEKEYATLREIAAGVHQTEIAAGVHQLGGSSAEFTVGYRLLDAAAAAVDGAAVADRLEGESMRHAAQFRYESSRATDTARLHHAEFQAEHRGGAEAVNGVANAAGAALETVADMAGTVIDGVASLFENLLGGGSSPAFTVQHVHHHHHHGISR